MLNKSSLPIWIAWEKHRRSRSLSKELGIELKELVLNAPPYVRYPVLIWRTMLLFLTNSSKLLFVQNPSIVLAALATLHKKFSKRVVVVDAHNAGIYPLEGNSAFLGGIARWIAKSVDYVIVTNEVLAAQVRSWGGTPLVLPDSLPVIEGGDVKDESGKLVTFICTWALDEPFHEVIEAANLLLDDDVSIHITGRIPNAIKATIKPGENVTLTGYLDDTSFDNLLCRSNVIIDLTTREDCLLCGAYEAVSAGVPVVLSDTVALKEYFYKGAVYTKNESKELAAAIKKSLQEHETLTKDIRDLREELEVAWRAKFNNILNTIGLNEYKVN